MPTLTDLPGRPSHGLVVHTGILVGPQGAVVIDPGPHARAGQAVRQAVQRELGLPVVGVINTHAAPEYVLGNAAFADLPIHASAITWQLMAQRCTACLARLTALLGRSAMQDTRIVLPSQTLAAGDRVALHGLRLNIRVFAQAHSPGDTALFDAESVTLFGGALACRQQVPDLQEASLYGWMEALHELRQWPAQHFIGAGLGSMADTVEATLNYLSALERDVSDRVQRGDNPSDTDLPLPAQWADTQRRHPLNVQRAWREIEERWWRTEPPE